MSHIVELCGSQVLVKQETRSAFTFASNAHQNIPNLGASFTLDRDALVLIHTQMSSRGGVRCARGTFPCAGLPRAAPARVCPNILA